MSEEIIKLEQKLQEKINNNTSKATPVEGAKPKKIDGQQVKELAERIRLTLNDHDHATTH